MGNETFYGLLTSVISATPIYPTRATENTTIPCLVYTMTDASPTLCLSGPTSPTKYTFDVDFYAVDVAPVLALMDQAREAINGYRDSTIQGVFLTSEAQQQEELGHHGRQTYILYEDIS